MPWADRECFFVCECIFIEIAQDSVKTLNSAHLIGAFVSLHIRFYTLLVISTALFDKPPFKNLIVNGLVLAA